MKQGLSIENVMPCFVKHRLRLRVFDKFCKRTHKYDPSARNHHNKTIFCVISDGHVCTLIQQQKRLEQYVGEDEAEGRKSQVGEQHLTKEDAEAKPAKMTDSIEDILRILKGEDGEHKLI